MHDLWSKHARRWLHPLWKPGLADQACSGHLSIHSIRVGTGENCVFYRNGGCSDDQIWYNGVNNCASFSSQTAIGSYKCVRFSPFLPSCKKNIRLTVGYLSCRATLRENVYDIRRALDGASSSLSGTLCARALH